MNKKCKGVCHFLTFCTVPFNIILLLMICKIRIWSHSQIQLITVTEYEAKDTEWNSTFYILSLYVFKNKQHSKDVN